MAEESKTNQPPGGVWMYVPLARTKTMIAKNILKRGTEYPHAQLTFCCRYATPEYATRAPTLMNQ